MDVLLTCLPWPVLLQHTQDGLLAAFSGPSCMSFLAGVGSSVYNGVLGVPIIST
jgi:hypothetical protein